MYPLLYILIGIMLFAVSFLARIWVRLKQRDFGVDTWYHLNYAAAFRKKRTLPAVMHHYLLDIEEQWYPPFLPFLISLAPRNVADRYHWLISATIDSVQAVILYIFSIMVTNRIDIAIAATLLYAASSVSASMATNLNTRPFASLILTLLMLALYKFIASPNIFSFLTVLAVAIILLHTHKMATQQFLFLLIGLAALSRNVTYIYIIPIIFIGAVIATKGHYIKILKNNIQIIQFWSKNFMYNGKHHVYDSPLYMNRAKAGEKRGLSGLKSHKIMFILARAQLLIFLFIAIAVWFGKKDIHQIDILKFLFCWAMINYSTVISTTYLPIFKYFGEGFNYLIYGIFPISFLVAYGVVGLVQERIFSYLLLVILLAMSFSVQFFTLSRQLVNTNSFVDNEFKDIIGTIKKLRNDNIMCIPIAKAEPIAYMADKVVLWGAHGSGWDRMNEFWPVLKVPIERLIEKYKISLLLIDKRFVDIDDLKINKYINNIYVNSKNYILAEVRLS